MLSGLVNVGAVLSLTVMVCTWFAAALPHLSTRCHVLVMTCEPSHGPAVTTSVKVACNPVEQLSASLVTSPVADTLASYPQDALVKIVMLSGLVNVGAVLSLTVMVCTWFAAALPQLSTRCHVLVMTCEPSHEPAVTTSVKVACNPVEQLSASLVTSPVADTVATYPQVALV